MSRQCVVLNGAGNEGLRQSRLRRPWEDLRPPLLWLLGEHPKDRAWARGRAHALPAGGGSHPAQLIETVEFMK